MCFFRWYGKQEFGKKTITIALSLYWRTYCCCGGSPEGDPLLHHVWGTAN